MNSSSARATLGASALLSLLLLAGCQKEAAPQQARPAPQVGVVTLEAQPFTLTSELPGRTAAYRIAEVRPQVDGIVLKRLFAEGREVKAGQQLYQIDPATYEATLKSAEATLLSSRSLAERYKVLVADQAVSRQQYDEARAAQLQAEAALEKARIDLRYTKVLAPIGGRIGRSAVTEGALVSSGQAQELAVIQQLDPIYVDVTQPATELLRLRRELAAGQLEKAGDTAARVSLSLPDGSAYAHDGRLEFSEVSVDPGTGSVTLRAVFPNPQHELLPGMFVQARLQTGSKSAAILAPQQGVTRNAKGEAVAMVVNAENKVEVRTLKAERTAGSFWLVSEGLEAGDRLITEGLQFIKPGVEVKVQAASNVPALGKPAESQPAAQQQSAQGR
ncbi:multidrug efflux system [Pseudomonas sp. OF001]|uniref:efflux RND transporter periplasmic adaptor subunit n=1 Tax=unclassified Pseudomonas TaxID=196821 RepID=UPI0010A62B0A|nr:MULTISPECIES: efflux RND transporter periplasmic adaptor subunit [unclassified Pseudomonas]THG76974.1 efflux RND transporter periplasmic adaptor subunit [Pseudomonas sp. A-1]CAD5378916.1 multidrug efflux system [Pseudomonas sp. OF001]